MVHDPQRGFTLPETLVAAAIAAAVLAASASALGGAVRTLNASERLNAIIEEAEMITARLEAGIRNNDLVAELEGWSVAAEPYQLVVSTTNGRGSNHRLVKYIFVHEDYPNIKIARVKHVGASP